MPIYNFKCPKCEKKVRRVLPCPPYGDKPCPDCDTNMERDGDGPTQRVVEVRDNGIMPKKVEQLANIDEILVDRSTKKSDGEII